MRRAGDALVELAGDAYVQGFDIAALFAHAEAHEETLHWLEKALSAREPRLHAIGFDRHWRFLRGEPRYHAILEVMGLTAV